MMLLCFLLTMTLHRPGQQTTGDIGVPRGKHFVLYADSPHACTMSVWQCKRILRPLADLKLPNRLWLAELGRPDTVSVYSIWSETLDVVNSAVGIAYRLKWELNEKEIAFYDSEHPGGPSMPA